MNMDLKSLIEKMDELSEAPAMSRADYDKFKAEDARMAAIEQVKKLAATPLNQIPRLGDAIDPKTGILYYGAAEGMGGNAFTGTATKYPFKWFKSTGPADTQKLGQLLKTAGLDVVPHIEKGLFGNIEYAKVEPEKLANIDKPPVDTTTTPTTNTTVASPCAEKIAKLKEIIKKLKAQGSTQAAMPAGGMMTGKDITGKPVMKGSPNDVSGKQTAITGLQGMQAEGFIAESLIQEFADNNYQVDEWSTQDTIDTARGAYQGLTFGGGDNITAGIKSAFGKDTYAQALAKEKEKTAQARARSPSVKFNAFGKEWNPSAFDAAELAGAVAVPIPGVGLAGQAAARGTKAALGTSRAANAAATTARVGTELAGTVAAMKGAEHVLTGHNLATQIKATGGDLTIAKAQDALGFVGKELDGKMGPLTKKAIELFQQDQKLTVTGKLDAPTAKALGV